MLKLNPNPGQPPVPAGNYPCVFEGIAERELNGEPKHVWTWRITNGEHAGKPLTSMTDANKSASPANKAGKFLVGMLGQFPEIFDLQKLIGKKCLAQHAVGPQGGKLSVQSVMALPE